MAKEKKKLSKLNQDIKEDFPTKEVFTISVHSLNNIVGKTLPITITIRVEYLDNILGESPPILVQNAENNPVQFDTFLKVRSETITVRQLDEITAHPIVFTVFYKAEENEAPVKIKSSTKGSKKTSEAKSSKTSGATKSEKSLTSVPDADTLGSANLDVLPLLCGEAVLKETLLLQDSLKRTGSEVTAWPNLPRLDVRVAPVEGALEGVQKPCNIVCITLGSLYNITPEFGNVAACQVTTMLPLFGRDEEDAGKISFPEGVITTTPVQDGESMKRWYSLAAITGKSALSKYRLNFDLLELKNTLGLKYSELKNTVNGTEERLEWNLLRRCWLEDRAQEEFYKKLVEYRCWPLEFHFPTKKVNKEKQKPKSRGKEETESEKTENRFVAFLELTNLLYPGVTKTHITSQLYTYVSNNVKEKWGEEIFPVRVPVPPTPPQTPVTKTKSPKSQATAKTKASTKNKTDSTKTREKIRKSTQPEQEMTIEEEVAVPMVKQDGSPVFITIEIELMHPLVKKKSVAEVLQSVVDIIPPRPIPERSVVSSQKVQILYQDCIESLVRLINLMYQGFYSFEDLDDINNDKRFLMHLHGTGAYSKMSATLHQVLMDYMKDKIGLPPTGSTEQEIQTYISDVYVKLVEEMNNIVEQVMEGHELDKEDAVPICSYSNLNYFAMEAMEQGNMEKAAEYLMKRIAHSKGEVAQYWLDFGIFHVVLCDYEKAAECGFKALSIDIRHKDGLLFYALLAWLREDFQVAELFFQALTELYPRCHQAWICFHFFYRQIDNKEGSEIAYINGIKSFEDLQNPTTEDKKQSKDHNYYLLSWCPGFEGDNSPFVSTAIHLLKLGFPEFAETCLARELLLQGQKTVTFLYYLAVSHYKQSRYEESLSHLEQALHLVWEDVRLWTLKGHNLYKMKKEVEATEAYQFVLNCEGVPSDLHLTHLRMGQFSLTEGDYLLAKQLFIKSCQLTPTPLLWLGLGMASYILEQFDEAEYSLNEANMLDPTVSDVWVLLALINLKRCRFKLAKKCENEALRLGLKNSPLSQELIALKETLAPCCS